MPNNPVHFIGYQGLGDSIFQRAFLRHFKGSYISTPWPELYDDLGLKCVRMDTKLRTQAKNAGKSEYKWYTPPRGIKQVKLGYGPGDMKNGSIISTFMRQTGVIPKFDLPKALPSIIRTKKPVALIRPVTVRSEWTNIARAPIPGYIRQAAVILKDAGYYVVSIADLEPGKEWIVGDEPFCHKQFHHGELTSMQLLSEIQHADLVVSGVGFMVPACIAAQTRLFCVLGGQLGHNAPDKISLPEHKNITYAMPDKPCHCVDMKHKCEKTISDFDKLFKEYLGRK